MLPPDARTVLTDALAPPPGAQLDHAVALTFTLDLEAALLAPLAFARHATADTPDPLDILNAIRNNAERIDIFAQTGHIRIPSKHSDLLAFLETSIHPVAPPKPGHLYHPKLWAARYQHADGSTGLRMLILSRNLTHDRSWDACLTLDGQPGTRPHASNAPLAALLRASADLAVNPLPVTRRMRIDTLAEDLRRAEWQHPADIRDIAFHALGIRGATAPDYRGTRNLIISPFIDDQGLATTRAPKTVIVSRQEHLDRLTDNPLDAAENVYVLSEIATPPIDGDPAEEAATPGWVPTGLHAKIYVIETGHTARVLVGSANATHAATHGNIELLAELTGSRYKSGIDTLVGAQAPFRTVLEPYERRTPPPEDEAQHRLESALRHIAATPLHATVTANGDGYRIAITSNAPLPALDSVARLTAELLTKPGDANRLNTGEPAHAEWDNLATTDITPYIALRANDNHGNHATTITTAQLHGDPPDRLDRILARQVDSPEKFQRLLALILGLTPTGPAEPDTPTHAVATSWNFGPAAGVLELLLRALVDQPAQIDTLGRLVDRLAATDEGRAIMGEEFLHLWDVVTTARLPTRPGQR